MKSKLLLSVLVLLLSASAISQDHDPPADLLGRTDPIPNEPSSSPEQITLEKLGRVTDNDIPEPEKRDFDSNQEDVFDKLKEAADNFFGEGCGIGGGSIEGPIEKVFDLRREYNPSGKHIPKNPAPWVGIVKQFVTSDIIGTHNGTIYAAVVYPSGNTYVGEWENGQPNGEGIKTFQDGSIYNGSWANGKKSGFGYYSYGQPDSKRRVATSWYYTIGTIECTFDPSNEKNKRITILESQLTSSYKGIWLNDKPHGPGTVVYKDGSYFKGEFENGRSMAGFLTYSSGNTKRAKWVNGELVEEFSIEYKNGSNYIGELKNGKRDGYGQYAYVNGSQYEGNWKNGEKHGDGKLIYNSGAFYQGSWENGKRHGIGVYIDSRGNKYIGKWNSGMKRGFFKVVYQNDDVFEGVFEHDTIKMIEMKVSELGKNEKNPFEGMYRPHGILTLKDGRKYCGQMKNKSPHGYGAMTLGSLSATTGRWENGKHISGCIMLLQRKDLDEKSYTQVYSAVRFVRMKNGKEETSFNKKVMKLLPKIEKSIPLGLDMIMRGYTLEGYYQLHN